MSTFISFNGECVPLEGFGLSPANRSFRYGDGLFETIRVVDGRMLWADQHYKRLRRSASILQMILPGHFSLQSMQEHIGELFAKNHPKGGSARIRFSLFRNDGGLYTPVSNKTSFLIESETLPEPSYRLNEEGIKLDIFPDSGKPLGPMSNLKTSSALVFVMAALYKTREDLDDCLILNHNGGIAEATSSNVFLVKDQELTTPGLDQDCVDGVMRSVLLELARESGLHIREAALKQGHLEQADELFLTNTINGIVWVRRFRNKTFGNDMSRHLVGLLNKTAGLDT